MNNSDKDVVELDNISILDIQGNQGKTIGGIFTTDELAQLLVDEWVMYVECHHCPRVDTCKYPEQHPYNEYKKREIICGVHADIIKKFIRLSFDTLKACDTEQQEQLLKAAFHLADYAINSETHIGMLLSDSWLEFLGEHADKTFARTVHLRERLNKAGQNLSFIPQLYSKAPILLVEGHSEKAFLDKLRETNSSWFSDLRVEVYGGSGNAHPRRIQMRLDKYKEDGYVCFMQGDEDGVNKDVFQKLIKQGTVSEEHVFKFKFDFETSIPCDLLLQALQNMGHLEGVELDEFCKNIDGSNSSIKIINDKYELDISPMKVDLADEIGWIIINSRYDLLHYDDDFLNQTELGRFIKFVIKIHFAQL